MENAVLTILSRIDPSNLPVVPRVLLDLVDATQKTEVNFKDLARIIGQDASLSSRVLAAANSSFYRQWGEITDLNRVIVVLGLSTVKTIAITRSVQQFFARIPQAHQNFLEIIWHRSLTCAHLARNLAKLLAYDFPDEAYLAGLIHRLGQLVLLECFPKEYPDFLKQHFDGQQQPLEKKMFGATHNEVGGYLIETWNIQSFISDAVLYQSQNADAILDSAKLVKIINLASQLCSIDTGKKDEVYDLADKLFGLNQPLLENMLEEVKILVEQTACSLGIAIANPDGTGIKCLTTEAQRNDNEKKLAEHIKEIALASAVKQQFDPPTEIHALVAGIQRDLSVLFDFHVAAVFLYRLETNSLVGILGDQEPDSLWPTISISISSDQSLLAKALLENRILHTFAAGKSTPAAIVDRQIQRLLGTEGMLIIPLSAQGQNVGVIVSGFKQSGLETLESKSGFITLFAREAALAFLKRDMPSQQTRQSIDSIRDSYHLNARKLVHEANNPLSIINNYLYMLGQKLGDDNADEIRIIQEEIDRVGKIILRLPEALESPVREDNRHVDINAVIIDLRNLFQSGLFKSQDINVNLKLDYSLPEISSNKSKLKQILTNLIKNSAEAMPSGGNITISTKDRVYVGDTCYAEIQVQDNGPGLSKEILNHLFKPLTSTKGKDHSGLGLTISKNLVDELGGIIQCDSTAGKGVSFRIFLPREPRQKEHKHIARK